MLKLNEYFRRDSYDSRPSVPVCSVVPSEENRDSEATPSEEDEDEPDSIPFRAKTWKGNAAEWTATPGSHLLPEQQAKFAVLFMQYQEVFRDSPQPDNPDTT